MNDSDFKFLLDVRSYMESKVGELEFAEDLLKKFLENNKKEGEAEITDEGMKSSLNELKWQLIKDQLVAANNIKVENDDVKAAAMNAARFQFAQYGMTNIPDEYLENYATEMLKHRQQVDLLINRCVDDKLAKALKEVVTLNHKAISTEDFAKMFEEESK